MQTVLSEFSGLRPIQPYEDPLAPGQWVKVDAGTSQVQLTQARSRSATCSRIPPACPHGGPSTASRRRTRPAAWRWAPFFSYPVGSRTVYSDIGLILLGLSIEQLTGPDLERAIAPGLRAAGLQHTRSCPWAGRSRCRLRRLRSAAGAGGGLWVRCTTRTRRGWAGSRAMQGCSAPPATWRLGRMYLDRGRPVLQPATVEEMTRLQAQDGDVRRGLGFALWSPDPEASGHAFGPAALGHTGFTGTSCGLILPGELVVAVMTNRVYYGRDAAGILAFADLHRAIVEAADLR